MQWNLQKTFPKKDIPVLRQQDLQSDSSANNNNNNNNNNDNLPVYGAVIQPYRYKDALQTTKLGKP